MTDDLKSADTGPSKSRPPLLAGAIELTPEAQAILTKQVNRKIVRGYKLTKAVFQALACSPMLISAFFVFVAVKAGHATLGTAVAAILFIGLPTLASILLVRLANKI